MFFIPSQRWRRYRNSRERHGNSRRNATLFKLEGKPTHRKRRGEITSRTNNTHTLALEEGGEGGRSEVEIKAASAEEYAGRKGGRREGGTASSVAAGTWMRRRHQRQEMKIDFRACQEATATQRNVQKGGSRGGGRARH